MATEKGKLNVNRVLAFLAGGLLVFAVMSLTVVSTVRKENESLTEALDVSQFEAGRLLADAQAHYSAQNYGKATDSLETLFENQPGSAEAATGRALLLAMETEVSEADARWEAALPGVLAAWSVEKAAALRMESDSAREKLETDMEATLSQAWEQAMAAVRSEWEAQASIDS